MLERLFRRFRAPIGPAWVEVDDLRRRLRRGELALVLDVREPDEFDGPLGHIPGALNVPLASLPARIAEFYAGRLSDRYRVSDRQAFVAGRRRTGRKRRP
jgi:rhodanese-related sulfurtransferase